MAGYTHKKRDAIVSFFGITENEIAAVGEEKIPELVLEQVTLTGLWLLLCLLDLMRCQAFRVRTPPLVAGISGGSGWSLMRARGRDVGARSGGVEVELDSQGSSSIKRLSEQ